MQYYSYKMPFNGSIHFLQQVTTRTHLGLMQISEPINWVAKGNNQI
jgi:hypothetical protein